MQEIEPSEVPYEVFFFHRKNDFLQILASAHALSPTHPPLTPYKKPPDF